MTGAWWRFADLLNEFAPVILLIGCAAILTALIAGAGLRRALVLPTIMLMTGSAALVLPELSGRMRSPTCRPGALKFVQFNVDKANGDPALAADWILRQNPDVISLEEGLMRGAEVVRLLKPAFRYQVSCLPGMRCSTVILSRQPALASGGLAHGDPENRKTFSATWVRFASSGGPFTFMAVHFDRPWQWDKIDRSDEVLSEFLAHQDRRRLVIGGDFNQTPWTFAMGRRDRAIGLPRLTRALPTWPAYKIAGRDGPPILPIDHVYAGTDWSVGCIERGPWLGSDHYPVVFSLSPAPIGAGSRSAR